MFYNYLVIIRYSEEEFNSAKQKDFLKIGCEYCSEIFLARFADVKYVLKYNGNPKGNTKLRYCSHKCWQKQSKIDNWTKVSCLQCNKKFEKKNSALKKVPNSFCSKTCAVTYNNINKKYGTRRSKFECWLGQELPKKYSNLDFVFNGKEAAGSELDIYIPSLKLAIEVQGIFHFEPIYGEEKLKQIQENDLKKSQSCLSNNIDLHLIDVSTMKNSSIVNFEKYSIQIYDILDQHKGS